MATRCPSMQYPHPDPCGNHPQTCHAGTLVQNTRLPIQLKHTYNKMVTDAMGEKVALLFPIFMLSHSSACNYSRSATWGSVPRSAHKWTQKKKKQNGRKNLAQAEKK